MQNVLIRDSVKYVGISSYNKFTNSNFKIFNLSHLVQLKSDDFNIEDIVQVKCNINILNYKIIKTPKCKSLEGHILTGNKVFFKGIINFNIQYTSYDKYSKIYFHNFKHHFVESIALPYGYSSDFNILSIIPNIIDITALKIDNNKIYLTLVNYISVTF